MKGLIVICVCLSSISGNRAYSEEAINELISLQNEPIAIQVALSTPTATSFTLSISAEEKADIAYIVSELGKASRMGFMQRYSYLAQEHAKLDKAGGRIANISVMQFLACIFSQSNLKEDMRAMSECNEVPWKRMRKSTVQGLRECHRQGTMMPQLEGFCSYLGIDYQKMKELADKGDWRGFLYTLL